MDFRAVLMGLSFAVIWSSAFTSARIAVAYASPLAMLSIRFLISGLLAVFIARMMGQNARFYKKQWIAIILFGICQNAIYLGLNFMAMQTIEAGFIRDYCQLAAPVSRRRQLGDIQRAPVTPWVDRTGRRRSSVSPLS